MAKYKVDDWVRLKGTHKSHPKEKVHIFGIKEVTCSIGTQIFYEGRLVRFGSYSKENGSGIIIIDEIEIAEQIPEPQLE